MENRYLFIFKPSGSPVHFSKRFKVCQHFKYFKSLNLKIMFYYRFYQTFNRSSWKISGIVLLYPFFLFAFALTVLQITWLYYDLQIITTKNKRI